MNQPGHAPGSRKKRLGLRRLAAAAAAVLIGGMGAFASAAVSSEPAQAAARVSVSGTPSVDGTSTLKLSGSGFQSVQNGFGGIYVLFGVAEGTWQPSKGGKTGTNLRYAYDDESNPVGYQLFVTFPGSSTAHAANGGTLKADGTWSGEIILPGARFTSYDRERNPVDVDCTRERCGIITIGAHGVANAKNETFTPIEFPAAAAAGQSGGEQQQNNGAAGAAAAPKANAQKDNKDQKNAAAPAAPAPGTAGGQQPVSGPLLEPDQVDAINTNANRMVFLLMIGVVLAICAISLAVGVGSYMAVKSLLLGVSPEALERVRTRRAKRAIAAEHKRERKLQKFRVKQDARTRKRERAADAKIARADMEDAGVRYPVIAEQQSYAQQPGAQDQPAAGPMRFFELIHNDAGATGRHTQRQAAGSQQVHSEGTPPGAAGGDSPTLVMDRLLGEADAREDQR